MIFLWVPETKQRTLEELDYIFAVPTGVFVRYQFRKALPYWFKRWVLFQKNATLDPLYQFETVQREGSDGAGDTDKAQTAYAENKETGVDDEATKATGLDRI
jgi:hypothetical protein